MTATVSPWRSVEAKVAAVKGRNLRDNWGERGPRLTVDRLRDHEYRYTDHEGTRVFVTEPYFPVLDAAVLANLKQIVADGWECRVRDGWWFEGTTRFEFRRRPATTLAVEPKEEEAWW